MGQYLEQWGHGEDEFVVSTIAKYSDDTSLNHTEVNSHFSAKVFEKSETKYKKVGDGTPGLFFLYFRLFNTVDSKYSILMFAD